MNCRPSLCAVATFLALTTASLLPRISAQAKDACTLVAAADVEAVLGEPAMRPQKESYGSATPQVSTCRFVPSQSQGKLVSVMLYRIAANGSTGPTPMSAYLKQMGVANVRQIPDIGVDAAWGSMSMADKLICQMWTRKDKSTWIAILVTGLPDDADTLSHVKTLADHVLSKLE